MPANLSFKAFGPIRYARIVYDPTTKRSRGTAFVHFWNEEDAHKVLHESESLNAGLYVGEVSAVSLRCIIQQQCLTCAPGQTSDKKQRAQPQSLLMADPGTTKASKLTLHGRVLAAVAAVSKDDADKLREDRDKKGAAKTDRRNLYLMREGGERRDRLPIKASRLTLAPTRSHLPVMGHCSNAAPERHERSSRLVRRSQSSSPL